MTAHDLTTSSAVVGRRVPPAWREISLLLVLWVAYTLARLLGDDDLGKAMGNAHALLDLERALHIDIELWANGTLHDVPPLALAASFWYASTHYLVTGAVLVWAYRGTAETYRLVRTALAVGSVLGLVGFVLLPMAPPRMFPGYTDTMAATSDSGWWATQASAPEGLGNLTRKRSVRALSVVYAVGTTVVVVVTANHWVLDAVAGVAVMAAGAVVAAGMVSRAPR
jgi:hypothetical protein